MKFKFILLLSILSISYAKVFSQDTLIKNGNVVFYYPNQVKSSEGLMRDGKPDGYWKNYYEIGIIKSEGNRLNFELDSTWKFYNNKGKLTLEVNYKKGKKNGLRRIISNSEIIEENYVLDVKQGPTKYFVSDTILSKIIIFDKGLEEGLAKEFDKNGTVITLYEYKKGMLISREKINRVDQNNKKQGSWMVFYPKGIIKNEVTYRDDKKNGYLKEYDPDGNLLKVTKYIDDVLQDNAEELKVYDIRTDYYSNGNVKIVGSYYDNKPDGIRREYNKEGKIEISYIFKHGIMIGKGIVDEAGLKQGKWSEYFDGGELKAEGSYKDNKRIGQWKFFYQNGKLEQMGSYNKNGLFDGLWKWYYVTGEVHREENYLDGLEDGRLTEYTDSGKVVTEGDYIEGIENGVWKLNYGDYTEIGKYVDGKRDSLWKSWYNNGQLLFEGKFIDDNPNGKHVNYWDNGTIKEQGIYVMGKKEGEWVKYDEEGNELLTTFFRDGIERKFENVDYEDANDDKKTIEP